MAINPINPLGAQALTAGNSKNAVQDLSDTFSKMFNEVNTMQQNADLKIEEFATSPEKDIHGTMIALQKADLSLRLFMQVRAKLTTAYQEIMRMQV
ncbi:MAG: flagellar hook-basal body complex protein FliE [Deltaproteobacteria bacterium]|nr:flagellar hook-basal body complex protein FliE [Deltaproteobacteria bacterium]